MTMTGWKMTARAGVMTDLCYWQRRNGIVFPAT